MIANLQPYPEYKESGVAWIRRVPKHWPVFRLWRLAKLRSEKKRPELPLLSVFLGRGVITYGEGGGQVHKPGKDLSIYQVVHEGDFVLNNQQAWRGSVGVSRHHGIISPAYVVLKLDESINSRFADYLFQSHPMVAQNVTASKGVGDIQRDIHTPWLKNNKVPIPPPEEQEAMVRFLDYANGRLERVIRAKRKVIALLHEQKQAIIHRAVTRGLDPAVPLKPSGIPWLGDIPRHWDFQAFARLARIVRGASPRPAGDKRFFYGNHIPWLTVGEITKDKEIYLTQTGTFLTKLGEEHSVRFPSGTLVLTNSGATLGVPKILSVDVCANDGIVAFLRRDPLVDPVFAYYYLSTLTERLRDELRQGGTQPNLNTGIIRSIACPLPPKSEQQAILKFLESELAGVRTAINRLEREISLLREYRTRLVADVVTGKLDVRPAARQLPEDGEELSSGADQADSSDSSDEVPLE